MNIDPTIVPRSYAGGMGEAVANRTVNRLIFTEAQRAGLPPVLRLNQSDPLFVSWKNAADLSEHPVQIEEDAPFMPFEPELRRETWADVAKRVAVGNTSLVKGAEEDLAGMHKHLSKATLLMSGRHLQHGDANQASRPMEVFTNCASAASSFILFYLLLNGSGVGRAYDDVMMKVDWRHMPDVHVVIRADHPDRFKTDASGNPLIPASVMTPEELHAIYDNADFPVTWFKVPDSRGGWAKANEILERMTYEKRRDEVLVLEFSDVRQNGSPIRGMQNRPSSGPGPLMAALIKIADVRHLDIEPWQSTMMIDHYSAECVLVGGARRAARMATKRWDDPTIFDFIAFKRNGEFWSSNNSVTIDAEFRESCERVRGHYRSFGWQPTRVEHVEQLFVAAVITEREAHAWRVLHALAYAAYHDNTGEPGLINQDKLHVDDEGLEDYLQGVFFGSRDYQVDPETIPMLRDITIGALIGSDYAMICNPCGEIALLMLGGYCVIADVVPFHADSDDEAEDAFRHAVRALIRTNTMDSLYNREVARTNRIGVGMTGFHEWAYQRFGFDWKTLINEELSQELWQLVSRFKRAVVSEAESYSDRLDMVTPHTNTTFKPAGTTSKLFGLSEGAHLPSMRWFLRWVQFRNDDPLIEDYRAQNYPIRQLETYDGTTIVGFPTAPAICELGGGDWVVTAAEATPEEQYQFLRLLEKYWIVGVEEDGVTPLVNSGNQVSYTLKYDPAQVSFAEFFETLIDGQFSIRCCSVMPQIDTTRYEYQPEEPITHQRYLELMAAISGTMQEDVDFDHIDCGTGACPIDFNKSAA